uniref:F-box domain-containing protein n=1 Tax=Panagrellus redivivus TaxID=6233 RepID=A0A7E4WAL0_PANRE
MSALPHLLLRKIILNIMNSDRDTESLLKLAMAGSIPLPMIKYIVNNGIVGQYVADEDKLTFHATFGDINDLRGNTRAYTMWLTSLIICPEHSNNQEKHEYKKLLRYEFPNVEHIAFLERGNLDSHAILPLLERYPKLVDLEIQGNMLSSAIPKITCPSIKKLQLLWQSDKGGIAETDLNWVKSFLTVFPNLEQLEITVENHFESDQPNLKLLHNLIKQVQFSIPVIITIIDECHIEEGSEYHGKIKPFLVNYTEAKLERLEFCSESNTVTFIHQINKPTNQNPEICFFYRYLRNSMERCTNEQYARKRGANEVRRVIRQATPLTFLR